MVNGWLAFETTSPEKPGGAAGCPQNVWKTRLRSKQTVALRGVDDRGDGSNIDGKWLPYAAAFNAAKPRSRSALRSSTFSSPIWSRSVGPPGDHFVAVR